jgi:hypothetical protein
VSTLIRIGSAIEERHKAFRLELASHTGFPELPEGPVVLVGALDNAWTMRLTQSLRYGFAINDNTMFVVDRKNLSARNWSVSLSQSPSAQSSDFAVIARNFDPTLDQPVMLAAGFPGKEPRPQARLCRTRNSSDLFLRMRHAAGRPLTWKPLCKHR